MIQTIKVSEDLGFIHIVMNSRQQVTAVALGKIADELTEEDCYELEQAILRVVNRAILQSKTEKELTKCTQIY